MAIDTAAKRLSSLDFEEVWAEAVPLPDGAIEQGDRQHAIWSYAGTTAPVAPTEHAPEAEWVRGTAWDAVQGEGWPPVVGTGWRTVIK